LLELMFQAGFSHLNLALVSSDKTVRETTKRPHTLEAYLKIVHRAHALGFQIVSYQILGLPNESLDSMIQTLAFNTRLPVLLGASPFYRTPASPIARGLDLTEEDYVKARLTAMAVETDEFHREDIYSLFITTRVINFLKGLRLSASTDVNALLDCSWSEDRTRIGFELLKLVRKTHRWFFWTNSGLRENSKFRPKILFRVLAQAGEIGCQNGQRIIVGEFSGSATSRWMSQPALNL
jgi:radical SAM superfamily enzyme